MMFLSWNSISEAKLLFTFEVGTFHEAINPDCPWRSTYTHRSDGSHAHLSSLLPCHPLPTEMSTCIQIGKGVPHGFILSPCLFKLYAEYIMRNAGLDDVQTGTKIAGRNINNLRYVDDTTLMAESEEELKSLLMKAKEESEKAGLKLNIQKTKIMASSPITSWQIDRETMETVRDFIFLGSKITPDEDCSHEIKRRLLLRRKAMTNIDSILNSRDITLPTKVCIIKAMVFFNSHHVWM